VTPVPKPQRDKLRERSDGICEVCGAAPATNWHHRKNRSQLGGNELSNALHLCGSGTTGCHGQITANPSEAVRHGWAVRSHGNPRYIPALRRGTWVYLDDDGGLDGKPPVDDTEPPWM
jgi:hypothetical protein